MALLLKVEYQLCLNNQAVPVEKKELNILDPLSLAEKWNLSLPEPAEVNLVTFKATADMAWFEKVLKLPSRWWVHNQSRIPLLLEIKEAIRSSRGQRKGSEILLPSEHKSLVLLEVRGKLLYVQNTSTVVILGLTQDPGFLNVPNPDTEPLCWFCTQLQKDIEEHLTEKPEKQDKGSTIPEEHQERVKECLEQLQEHSQCHAVHFVPSRMLFRILKKNRCGPQNAGRVSEIRVVGLNKFRKTMGSEGATEAQDPFLKSMSLALEFLDAPDDSAPVPSPGAPVPSPGAGSSHE